MNKKLFKIALLLLVFNQLSALANSGHFKNQRIIFIDNSISENCTNYNEATRSSGGGDKIAFKNLSDASKLAIAGDIIYIRQGTYNGPENIIKPCNAGVRGREIIFKNYNNENVTISNVGDNYPISIEGKNYITIEGINFNKTYAWGRIIDSNYIILKNNNFSNMNSGQWLALHFVNSNFNKVLNNSFYSPGEGHGKDNLQFIYSNHNLIEGNRIESTGHVLWAIKCGSFNVVKNNYFYSHNQKIGEVFDCNDGTTYTKRHTYVNATKHNLIEANIFAYTDKDRKRERDGYPSGPFSGIQYAGQNGIIRNNIFYNNLGGGLALTTYFDEAEFTTGNRVYNNLFYKNGHAGISISGSKKYEFSDNILINNILYKNYFANWNKVYNIRGWANADGKPLQIWTSRNTEDYYFENNNIYNSAKKENHLIGTGDNYKENKIIDRSLQFWEANYPRIFRNNIQENPQFIDEDNYDFRLLSSSPMIDKGKFLTATIIAGSGNQIQIEDVSFFYDGYKIEGELGDLIRLENGGTARIESINYFNNILILDRSLTWNKGEGISVWYSGSAPDLGPYEFPQSY